MTAYSPTDTLGQIKTDIALNLVPSAGPIPEGPFSVIMADPPWSYTLRETDETHRGRCAYPGMTLDKICELPVQASGAQESYLLLWVTNAHLIDGSGARVAKAWGYEPKSIHTWTKCTLDRAKIRFGVGHYGRNCTEHILVCKSPKAKSWTHYGLRNVPTAFMHPTGRHSEKPLVWNTVALRLANAMGGPMLELFARRKTDEWQTWGAEV